MDIIAGAIGIGTGTFARRGIHVYPALFQAVLGDLDIVVSQGLDRIQDQGDGFVVAVLQVHAFDNRCVEVRVLELINAQHALLEF